MKIYIQFIHIPPNETLEFYTINKLVKLGEKYKTIQNASVFFKRENHPRDYSRVQNKICEIELNISGLLLFAKNKAYNYESAIKETISSLTKQLEKRKSGVLLN